MRHTFLRKILFATAVALGSLICLGALIVAVLAVSRSEKSHLSPEVASEALPAVVAVSSADRPNTDSASTPGQIRNALIQAAAKLVDLKIVVAEKGDSTEREPGEPAPVVFKEMWMHKNSAQVRVDGGHDEIRDKWWTGFEPIKGPLTSARLESTPGLKACVDMSRALVYADSRPIHAGQSRTLHCVSKSPAMPNLFVPLIEFDKPWIPPNRLGGSPVVNEVVRRPLSAWRLLGDDKLGVEEVILAEITQHDTVSLPLKRHAGKLALTQTYLVWFSKKHGLMPVRIEWSVRYGLQGRNYQLDRRPDGQSYLVYEASDFRQFGDVWVPYVGRQCAYRPKQRDPKGSDLDALADKLLAEGTMRQGELQLVTSHEWRILNIEPIDPTLNLWFEPQPGAEVFNMDTQERYVQGEPP